MPTTYTPPDALFTPEVQQGIKSVQARFDSLLAPMGITMEVRPDYVRDGVAESAWVAWQDKDRYYIAMDGEPVPLA